MTRSSELPIHFITIVLNGEPFIRYHINVLRHLPFKWHWHLVEGIAELKHDTAWSLVNGGHIGQSFHRDGLSNDGTTEYIDKLSSLFPDNISVYRPESGLFWDGKRSMVNAPLDSIKEECLLWQLDMDEFWTVEQLCTARDMFIRNPDKTAGFYYCEFFVGPNLVVSRRECKNRKPCNWPGECASKNLCIWLRNWRYTPGCRWKAHEPPLLHRPNLDGSTSDLAEINPFFPQETEEFGLVFQHFAYVLPQQLMFKEKYYGYAGAYYLWLQLQKENSFPVKLKEFFPWTFLTDETLVNPPMAEGVVPIPLPRKSGTLSKEFVIAIDGVAYQYGHKNVEVAWRAILDEWSSSPIAARIVLIDREGTFPRIMGYRYRTTSKHDYLDLDSDHRQLQKICDEEGATLFISTLFSRPLTTRTLLMVHDMAAEVFGEDLGSAECREKAQCIELASACIAVSVDTATQLKKYYPATNSRDIYVVHYGIDRCFRVGEQQEIDTFKKRYEIDKPYYLCVSPWHWQQNIPMLLKAFSMLPNRDEFMLVWAGVREIPTGLLDDKSGRIVVVGELTNDEMRAVFSGAVALVYPSIHEGFGLYLLEAMACGCPVIASNASSLPETVGDAAHLVSPANVDDVYRAMLAVQIEAERRRLIERGIERARVFSWPRAAGEVLTAISGSLAIEQGYDDVMLNKASDY